VALDARFRGHDEAVILRRILSKGFSAMTKLLDQALEAARSLPPAAQDDIAGVVLRLAGADDDAPVPLTPDEQAVIAASKAAAARGEFATDEEVRAVWAKNRDGDFQINFASTICSKPGL
jgi:hypothetical protein